RAAFARRVAQPAMFVVFDPVHGPCNPALDRADPFMSPKRPLSRRSCKRRERALLYAVPKPRIRRQNAHGLMRSIHESLGRGEGPAAFEGAYPCGSHLGNQMVTQRRPHRAAVFRAFAAPPRREILGLLRGGPCTVGEIAANFRTSRPAISKHLRLLRSVGLVVSRQDGTARICELNARPLRAVSDWLQHYETFWRESLSSLKRYIEEEQ